MTASLWISQLTKESKTWSWSWLFMWNYNPGALLFLCLFLFFSLLLFSFPTGGWPSVCLSVRVGSCINLSYLSIDLSFSLSVHLWENHHHTGAQKCLQAHQDLNNMTLWSQFFFFFSFFKYFWTGAAHIGSCFWPTRTIVQFIVKK